MEKLGVDYDTAYNRFREIDGVKMRHYGAAIARFPHSLRISYEELVKEYGLKLDKAVSEKIEELGWALYKDKSSPMSGAKEVLNYISTLEHEHKCCILTRGEMEVQLSRAVDSGYLNHFDQVFVCRKKTPELFVKICTFYNTKPENAVMIGNSLYSDILPALEAGLYGIYIKNGTYELDGHYNVSPENFERLLMVSHTEDVEQLLRDLKNEYVHKA